MEIHAKADTVEINPNTKITIEFKKKFWQKYILDKLVEKPNKCEVCNYTSISIAENDTINNLYIGKCKPCTI